MSFQVRYRAKNIFGWGAYSDTSVVKTIMEPAKVENVGSEAVGTNIQFYWDVPDARGSVITHYDLQIENRDGVFVQHPLFCHHVTTNSC